MVKLGWEQPELIPPILHPLSLIWWSEAMLYHCASGLQLQETLAVQYSTVQYSNVTATGNIHTFNKYIDRCNGVALATANTDVGL